MMTTLGNDWYTSSYSKNQGQCVEVKVAAQASVHVRDSQNPRQELNFTIEEWQGMIDRVKISPLWSRVTGG